MNDNDTDTLKAEAEAFDRQILERIANGHIPDLRRAGRCDYFYNNVWRDQFFANLYFGELVKEVVNDAARYMKGTPGALKLLEVGCGPGHVSLELARNGFDVTGLDISETCVRVARQFADSDPWKTERGNLHYVQGNFLQHQGEYHIVLFTASLHHFPNSLPIIQQVEGLLLPGGMVIADEPVRDRVSERNVAVLMLIQGLLSGAGALYESLDLPTSNDEMDELFFSIYRRERYEEADGSKTQSVNDNEAGFDKMVTALNSVFNQLEFRMHHALFHQVIGGVRLADAGQERKMAAFIKTMDEMLCRYNAVDPTNFYFVGRKK